MTALCETAKASLLGGRSVNQDRCGLFESPATAVLVVADGMGGHPRGETAAQIVVEVCERAFSQLHKPLADPVAFIDSVLREAHELIVAFGRARQPPIDPRTTAVVAVVQRDTAWWGHVGDSRLYLLRGGEVVSHTRDHSYVERLREEGLITADQVTRHPLRNFVTRCLGGRGAGPEITHSGPSPLLPRDLLLLCTDGFWSQLGKVTLAQGFDAGDQPLAQQLAALAERAATSGGADSDNVTAVALRWRPRSRAPAAVDLGMELETRPRHHRPERQEIDRAIDELRSAVADFEITPPSDEEQQR